MLKTKVLQRGVTYKEILHNSIKMEQIMRQKVKELGQRALNYMLETIEEGIVRPSPAGESNLMKNIKIEYFSDGWGIGNIADLKTSAPYFLALNFGFSGHVGKKTPKGSFSPGDPRPNDRAFRSGRFYSGKTDGDGKTYCFVVNKPIQPIDYIEKTANWLESEINKLLNIRR